jgi:hypothetical protein
MIKVVYDVNLCYVIFDWLKFENNKSQIWKFGVFQYFNGMDNKMVVLI